jgi:preprotein translocase subunit Sec61beta
MFIDSDFESVTEMSAEECFRKVKAGQTTVTEARIARFNEQSEEEGFRFEQDEAGDMIGDLVLDREDDILAGMIRFWEQDEL